MSKIELPVPVAGRAFYPIKECRALLGGLSQSAIYALINGGKLATVRVGRRRFATPGAIEDCVRQLELTSAGRPWTSQQEAGAP